MSYRKRYSTSAQTALAALLLSLVMGSITSHEAIASPKDKLLDLVGTQYDTTHIYVTSDKIDALVTCFIATFGGASTKRIVTNVLPVPSSTESQAVLTPFGNLSVFAFQTPVPYPFGQERNGYLVSDMDKAVKDAQAAGAEVIVQPFPDIML